MKNIILTPILEDGYFDLELSYEFRGKKETLRLSDYIFTDSTNRFDPERRVNIHEDALRGFAYFGGILTQVKDSLVVAEERYNIWYSCVRDRVQEYLRRKIGKGPTKDDIEAGILTLSAFLVPTCECGKKAAYFHKSSKSLELDEVIDEREVGEIIPTCKDHKISESVEVQYITEHAKKPLVVLKDDIVDSHLERYEYVITGDQESSKTIALGMINEAFQLRIGQYRNLMNYKNSRGGLEIVVKAFEMARETQISPHSLLKKEYKMGVEDSKHER